MTFKESLQGQVYGTPSLNEDTEMIRAQVVESELENMFELLREKTAEIADKLEEIEQIKSDIREVVLRSNNSFKCKFGSAVITAGRTSVKWNDDALLGYAASHPEIEQFRSESIGKPYVSIKVI